MKVTCAQCLAVYNISEEKLRKEVSRTTCRKCGYKIEIRRPNGVPKLQTSAPLFEHVPTPSINIMDQAIPKRLNDDERTHLDESRAEKPRPETNTNLAFGPSVAFMVEEEDSGFSEEAGAGSTAPSIQKLQEEKEKKKEPEQEDMYRLDWAMVFGLNLLSIVGVALVAAFRNQAFFVLMLGIVLFGAVSSLLLVVTSRFGSKEASLYSSIILGFFFSVCMALLYIFYFEELISTMNVL